MSFFSTLAAVLLALSASIHLVQAKDVFAHVIVGNTYSWNANDGATWASQIQLAKDAHLTGFALNIANDGYTEDCLDNAYKLAAQAGLTCFISFDFNSGSWTSDLVAEKLNRYMGLPAQYKYNGMPLVSTFSGYKESAIWADVKSKVPGFVFLPDWSDTDPATAVAVPGVDGLFSWDAWPVGQTDPNAPGTDQPTSDQTYLAALGNGAKPYMKPISPWFYANVPANDEHWLWRGDNLWHDSWVTTIKLGPELAQILTWNDWVESTYITSNPAQISDAVPECHGYLQASDHSPWLADLPFYIDAYKSGAPAVADTPHFTFWHRLSPGAACGDETKCNNPHYQTQVPATSCDRDAIFFTVFPAAGATSISVSITMAGQTQTVSPELDESGAAHGSVDFSSFSGLGAVTVSVSGAGAELGPVTGKEISSACGAAGWNVFVGGSGSAPQSYGDPPAAPQSYALPPPAPPAPHLKHRAHRRSHEREG